MELKNRRILYLCCLIAFLVSSPLIILYTFGFRYDFTQKKVTQTGIINLTPNPQSEIKILVNDKEEFDNLNIKGIFNKDYILYNLMPKTYNVKVEKTGYHTWEKNLVVMPGLITYGFPLLLPTNPKTNLIFNDSDILLWKISDKFKKIFFLKKEGEKISANIYDFSKKILNTIYISETYDKTSNEAKSENNTFQSSKIFFSPDGKKFGFVLPEKNTKIVLLNSNEKNISLIADFVSTDKILYGQWDDSNRYFFYLNEKKELNYYDTSLNQIKKILENILSFSLKDKNIYYFDQNSLFIYQSPINNLTEKIQFSNIPLNPYLKDQNTKTDKSTTVEEGFQFLISAKNTLAIITPEKNLFIVSQNSAPINLGGDIESAVFSVNGEKLIFNSQFEIFINTPGGDQENLVTRLSQNISNIGWYSDNDHIWFLANQRIKNIELDPRPVPNIVDFINLSQKNTDIIYADSNIIYYDQRDGDNFSIYRVSAQN